MRIISHGKDNQSAHINDKSIKLSSLQMQLREFELGNFLLDNLGLNGYWTSYILLHPDKGRLSRLSSDGKPMGELESWLLDRCPIFLATQERFRIFKKLTQPLLVSSMKAASIPCGLMDDLLGLTYDALTGIQLTGVDLDEKSLLLAKVNAKSLLDRAIIDFELKDAWALQSPERWDLITSNGLNIYVADEDQCVALYTSFAQSLKPQGHLVISFITPPTTWMPHNSEDLAYQKLIFTEAIPVKWQCVRSEETTRRQLSEAGLDVLAIEYDSQRMFPAVLARKR